MKISEQGINLIKHFESCKLIAYKCEAGVKTIGFGHTENVDNGMVISEANAIRLLKDDLKRFEAQIDKLALSINQNQYDALVSFTFNLGIGNLQSSTLLKKIKENPDNLEIAGEFIKWINAGGEKLRGLLLRRLTEAVLYFS